ncbi:Uncharacterised protein, partial [Mycoplasmopsis synoviae]
MLLIEVLEEYFEVSDITIENIKTAKNTTKASEKNQVEKYLFKISLRSFLGFPAALLNW